jgi:putative ABC transport system permease protein
MGSLIRRVRTFFDRTKLDERLRDEWQLHADLMADDHVRQGLSPDEAKRQARLAIGGLDQVREASRDALGFRFLDDLVQDIRFALRQLRRTPAFTAVAVMTLALGIGANTAIFTVVNAVLLRPLPFKDAGRLVMLFERDKTFSPDPLHPDRNGMISTSLSGLLDWRAQTSVFEEVAAYYWFPTRIALVGAKEPEEVFVGRVTANFFSVLGVPPMVGRAFLPGSDQPGKDDVIVLGHALWQRRFASNPNIVGMSITAGNRSYTVVGVMPPGFQFPRGEEAWVPHALQMDSASLSRGERNLDGIARLKPGVPLAQARAVLETLAATREREFPRWQKDWTAAVIPLREHLVGDTGGRLLLLFGATLFVVLIACANLGNMLLARGSARVREMAVRAALGASRFRLFRQAMVETLVLAVLGGAIGIAIAFWCTRALVTLGSATVPQLSGVRPDWWVLLFALGASVVAGILSSLAPSLRVSWTDLSEALKEGLTAPGGARSAGRLGGLLVVTELAAALVLLTGAGLMVNTLARLSSVDLGFRPDHLLTMRLTLPAFRSVLSTGRLDAVRVNAFFEEVLQRVSVLPGVRSVGLTDALPLSGVQWGTTLTAEGRPPKQLFDTHTRSVSIGYFETMNIPLVRGRTFRADDTRDTTPVAIVNETLARQIWPNEDPVGKRVTWTKTMEVVGVVGAVRHLRLDLPGGPEIYVPLAQRARAEMFLAVRASAGPSTLASAVRGQIWSVDKNQPIEDIRTMDDRIAAYAGPRRFYALLLGIFAAIAVVLAVIGVYGVISYSVSQRQHEVGIRMALGAGQRHVLALVLRQGVVLAVVGIGIGVAGALVATPTLSSLLYGVRPTDPITFAGVSVLLAGVVLAACYVPARRAARLDPLVALRWE